MKHFSLFLFLLITFLSFFLRFYQLDKLPYGFHVDEAKAAWNAYSILKTAHDDHGKSLPLYYDSFGDFRPTGIIYSLIPSILLFGHTLFAVRFPSAFLGAFSFLPLALIFIELVSPKYKKYWYLPALFLAINPWHIMVSRATSEVVMALFFFLFAFYFLLKTFRQRSFFFPFLSIFFVLISFLFYHSIRVLTPIFFLTTFVIYYREIRAKNLLFPSLVLLSSTLLLTALFFLNPASRGRLSQVSLLNDPKIKLETTNLPNQEGPNHIFTARLFHNKYSVVLKNFIGEYSNYFGISFLTGDQAKPQRYTISNFGLITYAELGFFLLALCLAPSHPEIWLYLLLLLISPLPAAVTNEDTPNLHRSLFMVPFLVILESYGFLFLASLKKYSRPLISLLLVILTANFIYFWHSYSVHQKFSLASYFRDAGNLELATKIMADRQKYPQIILTNYPDDFYPWFAFLGHLDPASFNSFAQKRIQGAWQWENITFSSDHCPTEKIILNKENLLPHTLIVDAEGCRVDPTTAEKNHLTPITTIRRPDLSDVYLLWEKN